METENSGPQHQEKGKRKSSGASSSKNMKLIKFCVASDCLTPESQVYHIKDEKVSNKNANMNSSFKHSTLVNTCHDEFKQQPNKILESSIKRSKIDVRLLQHIAEEINKQTAIKERPFDVISHVVEILGIKELSRFTIKKKKTELQTMYSCDFSIDDFKISSESDVSPYKAKLRAAESGVAYFLNPSNFNLKSYMSEKSEDVCEHGQQQNDAASTSIKLQKTASPLKEDKYKSANNTVYTDNKSNTVNSNHLNYIQKYIQEVRNLLAKRVFPMCAIRDAAQNVKISDKINLFVTMDPKSPKHKPVFNARFYIENHLIASSDGSSKKNAKVNTLQSAINIMLNPSELVSVLSNVCQQCKDKALEITAINNVHTSSVAEGSKKAESDLSISLEQHKTSVESNCNLQDKYGKTEPVISANSEQIGTSLESNLLQEMPGKIESVLSTDPKQQRKSNHKMPKMSGVISCSNSNKQSVEKLCFSDMDDQSLIKILSGRLKNIRQKNINAYNRILIAVKAANMMDIIKFNTTTNSGVSGKTLTFCCEFYVRNTLVASGTGLEIKKAMQKACENTLSVLIAESIDEHTTPCETETSLYDVVSPKLKSDVSFDRINKSLFDSSIRRKFVLLDHSEYKLKCNTNPMSVLSVSAAFSRKTLTYKYETMETGTQQNLIRAEINFDGEIIGSGTGASKQEAKLAAATDTLESLRKNVYTIKVKSQDESVFTVEPEQLRNIPSVSSALTEDNIGCKMMKMMGWTGGGIGKSSGITEPISVSEHRFGQGLGYVENKNNNPQMKDFKSRVFSVLKDYSMSSTTSDLIFSSRFTKEERAEIHKIASKFGVQTASYGKGSDRYMIVKRKFQVPDLLYLLLKSGGSTEKYELVDRST